MEDGPIMSATTLRHRIAHLIGWNYGYVTSWRMDTGEPYIGFRCATCGRVNGYPLHSHGKDASR